MKRRGLFLLLLSLMVIVYASAVDVAREEFENISTEGIEFQNFQGIVLSPNTEAEIRGIGRALANVAQMDGVLHQVGDRYSIREAGNDEADGLFAAAILYVNEGALVENVRNLRLIISGYLEIRYGFSASEADTLAYFLTFYNAIHRGNLAFFQERYKPETLIGVTAANVGLSTIYSEWAGNTRIFIPLNIDNNLLLTQFDGDVIDAIRESEDDMGIDQREALNLLLEESLAADEASVEELSNQINEIEEQIAQLEESIDMLNEELAQLLEENDDLLEGEFTVLVITVHEDGTIEEELYDNITQIIIEHLPVNEQPETSDEVTIIITNLETDTVTDAQPVDDVRFETTTNEDGEVVNQIIVTIYDQPVSATPDSAEAQNNQNEINNNQDTVENQTADSAANNDSVNNNQAANNQNVAEPQVNEAPAENNQAANNQAANNNQAPTIPTTPSPEVINTLAQIAQLEEALARLQEENERLRALLAEKEAEIAAKEAQIEAERAQLEADRAALANVNNQTSPTQTPAANESAAANQDTATAEQNQATPDNNEALANATDAENNAASPEESSAAAGENNATATNEATVNNQAAANEAPATQTPAANEAASPAATPEATPNNLPEEPVAVNEAATPAEEPAVAEEPTATNNQAPAAEQQAVNQQLQQDLADAQERLDQLNRVAGTTIYFMLDTGVRQGGRRRSVIVSFDLTSQTVSNRSPDNIASHQFAILREGLVAITEHGEPANPRFHLTLFDLQTLQPIAISDIPLHGESFIYVESGMIYAMTAAQGDTSVLIRFDIDLEVDMQSDAIVNPSTTLTQHGDFLFVEHRNGGLILVLNREDLSLIAEIRV